MRAIAVTGIKDLALSDGGKQASFTLATKYAGDLAVTMPAQCLDALKSPDGGAALKPPGNGAKKSPVLTRQTCSKTASSGAKS